MDLLMKWVVGGDIVIVKKRKKGNVERRRLVLYGTASAQ
jgi:hypothetical protein